MISKSVKAKRRQRMYDLPLIEAALYAAVPEDAGTQTDHSGKWLTCHALNQMEGIKEIPKEARYLAQLPRSQRWEAGAYTSSSLCAALGAQTISHVLRDAGLA